MAKSFAAGMLFAVSLTSWGQPVITDQPRNQTAIAGATARFTVGATGAPPLSYQWRSHLNNPSFTNIPFGTEATLALTNVQPTTRRFAVVVTDAGGLSATSSPLVTLTVVTPPVITPANPTASLFADVTLVGSNAPAGPVSYQWLFNGEPIAGAVTNRLVVTNVQKTNAGNYAIAATYAFGLATSQVATLKIVPFNSMYCFGYSWTDTHNCSRDPTRWYHNHACNGPMWPEFLSTNLGLAYVEANNYAVCGAGGAEVLAQVQTFPAPPKPQLSLYCLMYSDDILWGFPPNGIGGVYINVTNDLAWNQAIQTGVLNNSNAIHRLYAKGARTLVVQSEFDGGLFPYALSQFGTNASGIARISEYCRRYNDGFANAVNAYVRTRPDLHLIWVDLYSNISAVVAEPTRYGFTKSNIDALNDPALVDESFSGPGADYVFWDGLHATSKLNKLITSWNSEALRSAAPESLAAAMIPGGLDLRMTHLRIGRDYKLQTSSDLANWNDVQTFTASAGTNQWSGGFGGLASKFFRLSWTP